MSDAETTMSLPLDPDGFLRRACPTCEREFKWFQSADGEGDPVPVGGYYCPYCEIQGPPDSWWTEAQLDLARNTVARNIVGPELQRFAHDIGRNSSAFIRFEAKAEIPSALDPLFEPNDMRPVRFACHPAEPVKVLDDWDRAVHCLVCSRPSDEA
jgi:hypothetical protein